MDNKKFFGYLSNGAEYELDSDLVEIGDGYHTLHELYQHRMALNAALFHVIYNTSDNHDFGVYKSKNHHPTSDPMFDGYFIVFCIDHFDDKWISYHYALKHWDEFNIPEAESPPEYPNNHISIFDFAKKLRGDER